MTDFSIRVTELGKSYKIGTKQTFGTARDAVSAFLRKPFLRSKKPLNGEDYFWALKGASFTINPGEVVGIIGRNGAGKSTLLKILSRITYPTEGMAELSGRVGTLLEVGTGFHPELTGRENVFLNGAILGMSRREMSAKFDEIVDFADIGKFLNTPVKRYSSGMYVRLAFAVAAHLQPEILLVDEVLAVGDASFQSKCLGKMSEVAQSGRTVLFVSHNVAAITRLCTRGLYLKAGRVDFDGTAEDAVSHYLGTWSGGGYSTRWDLNEAPGNGDFLLTAVELLDESGAPIRHAVLIDQAVSIRLEYFVRSPGLRFRCAINLYKDGTCAFPALEPTEQTRHEEGRYESLALIPPNLLAEGVYSLGVSIFSSRGVKAHLVRLDDVIVFQVTEPMTGETARGDYAERLTGVLRPKLDWTLRYEGPT